MDDLEDALEVLKRRYADARQDALRLSSEAFRAQNALRDLEGRAQSAERFEMALVMAIEVLLGEQRRRSALSAAEPKEEK